MQLDVLVRAVTILGTITATKTTNLWDFWYPQCSVLLWFHLLKSCLSPVSCLPWRCHPYSGSEEVEGLMTGWSACGGEVVLSKLSCHIGGNTIRRVHWLWKWKRDLAGRVLYPWRTLSLTGASYCCSTVRWSPTVKGFASLQSEIPCESCKGRASPGSSHLYFLQNILGFFQRPWASLPLLGSKGLLSWTQSLSALYQ